MRYYSDYIIDGGEIYYEKNLQMRLKHILKLTAVDYLPTATSDFFL